MNFSLSLSEVSFLANKYNVIPISYTFGLDTETPVSLYLKLEAFREDYSFLLESVTGGEHQARYSYIGISPHAVIKGKQGCYFKKIDNTKIQLKATNPMDALEEVIKSYKPCLEKNQAILNSGLVGFFSYDCVSYIENIHPKEKQNSLGEVDMVFVIPKIFICLDHVLNRVSLVGNLFVQEIKEVCDDYQTLTNLLKATYHKIIGLNHTSILPFHYDVHDISSNNNITEWQSSTTEKEFKENVEKTKKYIRSGDIFQAVLSRRYFKKYEKEAFNLYRALRSINPSPYMFYLNFKEYKLIGSSPEILFKKEKNKIIIRPIAGTIQRGKTLEDDEKLSHELLQNEKEQAEHIMLLDLARNDIARVSMLDSVYVEKQMFIEKYSHVMHIVSNVIGTLKKNTTGLDCLKAVFPAGTLSGAPKIRAMQIIEELEKEKRGPYGGCVAYYNFNGDMDTAIILRTMFYKNNFVYIHSGAGIVHASTLEGELQEVIRKSMALFKAVEIASF